MVYYGLHLNSQEGSGLLAQNPLSYSWGSFHANPSGSPQCSEAKGKLKTSGCRALGLHSESMDPYFGGECHVPEQLLVGGLGNHSVPR